MGQPFFKSVEIIGAILLIDLIGHRVYRIDAVKADTALKARTSLLAQDSEKFHLLDQITDILVYVGETAYRSACQM